MSRTAGHKASPTREQFAAYERIFDHFNRGLFQGALVAPLLNFSRAANSYGFFAPNRWTGPDGKPVHEISLNPDHLQRPAQEVVSTIVHEMCHLWQHEHGTPGRPG